jgi:hypothetical protein
MNLSRRLALAGLFCMGLVTTSALAQPRPVQTAYFSIPKSVYQAYLVSWLSPMRAEVVDITGIRGADQIGTFRKPRLRLDQPLVSYYDAYSDVCGSSYTVQSSTHQLAFESLRGDPGNQRALVTFVGQDLALDGCLAGQITPFRATTVLNELGMVAREPMTDLRPGVQLAGLREAGDPVAVGVEQQLATFLPGRQLRFDDTGTVVDPTFTDSGWLVYDSPDGRRGYTRLFREASAAEYWLEARFEGGKPVQVINRTMVKTRQPAGFGSVAATARHWESGLFIGIDPAFFIDLYRDFTGERISIYQDPYQEVRTPINWGYEGNNVVQARLLGTATLIRTWRPIRNQGPYRWVLESEVARQTDGSEVTVIAPRVNFYVDQGPASPPALAARPSHGRDDAHRPAASRTRSARP